MTALSSNPSFIVQIGEEYPSPSNVCAPNLVTVKLSGKDRYPAWKTQILCLLTSHNMLGFVNGAVVRPEGNVPTEKAWMRSDSIVKSWILGSVSEKATMDVVDRLVRKIPNADFTAKDVWDELECIYGPGIVQQARAAGEIERKTKEGAKSEDKSNKYEKRGHKKLYESIVKRKMNLVNNILEGGGVTVTDKITINGDTALHVAVGTSMDKEFFEELLKKTENLPLKDLKNSHGSTLLHIAATVGNFEAAEILMDKYPDMLYKTDNQGKTPLVVALSKMHQKFYWALLEIIDKQRLHKTKYKDALFSGASGDELLVHAISCKDFYMARNLIWWRCRKLDSDVVLMAIAQNYPRELSFWERRVAEFKDTRIVNTIALPFVNRRYQKRHEAFQVLKSVCDKIKISSVHKKYYTKPVLEATRLNALEVLKVIVYHFPDAFWSASEEGHNVIQYAVINRSEKIYNLLYHMSEHKNVYKTIKDASMNNLLHLVARLAPSEKLNPISGAALQIQYELQWYKEVERFVCPLNITEKNSSQETPQMVFTATHKELVTEGEKWMKSTAESYTITAALITTIVFAAAITVPGGNKDTGVPIFTNNPAFTIFAVSDAISLFTAVMSLLMFLSILTARFAEQDFLFKLPTRLIIGLVTLFISTITMIIAFGAALFIVFGQNSESLLIIIGALTGLTITFFVALQFHLVVDHLMWSTYGRSIFGRRNATFKACLQNYINKMTWEPILEDEIEEREFMMENDSETEYYFVHSADDIPFNI